MGILIFVFKILFFYIALLSTATEISNIGFAIYEGKKNVQYKVHVFMPVLFWTLYYVLLELEVEKILN